MLRLKFVSECSCFVSLDAAFYYIIFYYLLERFNYKPVSPRSAFLENWKSAIFIGMSDGGHKKGIGEGSGLTTYKSSHKAIYDHQSRDRKIEKLVY